MKIEWLNKECTEALIVRGWFRKQRAHVRRSSRREDVLFIGTIDVDCWVFAETCNRVGWWIDMALTAAFDREASRRERAQRRAEQSREWTSVKQLPLAQVHGDDRR